MLATFWSDSWNGCTNGEKKTNETPTANFCLHNLMYSKCHIQEPLSQEINQNSGMML